VLELGEVDSIKTSNWRCEQDILQLDCGRFPSQLDFMTWASAWLTYLGAKINLRADGADRAQVYFVFQECMYILCFESTCEAIWIESLGEHKSQDVASILLALN